jgi:hypothetical protein
VLHHSAHHWCEEHKRAFTVALGFSHAGRQQSNIPQHGGRAAVFRQDGGKLWRGVCGNQFLANSCSGCHPTQRKARCLRDGGAGGDVSMQRAEQQ